MSVNRWLPTSINWTPCFTDLESQFNIKWQCANLTVPMDYRSADNKTTQIGIVRGHSNDVAQSTGVLFANAGDPGTSYTPFILIVTQANLQNANLFGHVYAHDDLESVGFDFGGSTGSRLVQFPFVRIQ